MIAVLDVIASNQQDPDDLYARGEKKNIGEPNLVAAIRVVIVAGRYLVLLRG